MSTPEPRVPHVREGVCPLTTRQICDRVLTFTEEVNRIRFYVYQKQFARRVIESLLLQEGATLTGIFARQSGKSEVVAGLALGLTLILPALAQAFPEDDRLKPFVRGFRVGIFAPSNKHSGIVYFRMRGRVEALYFEAILADPDINLELVHSRGDSFAFSNGSVVEAHTASINVLNEGGTFHLIVTDESQRLATAKINKELRPMLASTNGTMVQIGTAFMSQCQFRVDITNNIESERQTGRQDHFEFDYEQCIADRRRMYEDTGDPAHIGYEQWVMKELARVGGNIDDESFRMNFRLLWSESYSQALDMQLFHSLGYGDITINQPWEVIQKLPPGRLVAGLDVAKDGDNTWVTILHVDANNPIIDDGKLAPGVQGPKPMGPAIYYRTTIVGWMVTEGNFEGNYGQYAAIQQYLALWPGLDTLTVDATGMGDPVCERFGVLLPHMSVVPFRYSSASKHELYRWYFQEISAKRFGYAANEATQETAEYQAFIKQHKDLVRQYNGNYLQVFASEGGHDDAPDSAALALWGAKGEAIPMVDMSQGSATRGAPLVEVNVSSGVSILSSAPGGTGRRSGRYLKRHG